MIESLRRRYGNRWDECILPGSAFASVSFFICSFCINYHLRVCMQCIYLCVYIFAYSIVCYFVFVHVPPFFSTDLRIPES